MIKEFTIDIDGNQVKFKIGRPIQIRSEHYKMSFSLKIDLVGIYINNVIVSTRKSSDGLHVVWSHIPSTRYRLIFFEDKLTQSLVEQEIIQFYKEITESDLLAECPF